MDACGIVATIAAVIAPLGSLSVLLAALAALVFYFADKLATWFALGRGSVTHLRWFSGIALGAALLTLTMTLLGGEQKSAAAYLAGISGRLDRANETLTDIKGEVQQGKREKSADPRKELANMGVPWSMEAFSESVHNGDARTVELFLQGGMPVNGFLLQYFTIDATPNDWGSSDFVSDRFPYNEAVANLIADQAQLAEDACNFQFGAGYLKEALAQPGRAQFLQRACKSPRQKADLETAIARAQG
ncbi:MAG TPA: hypothetical protein VFZ91_07925 [Allosphingosinicella sp.]